MEKKIPKFTDDLHKDLKTYINKQKDWFLMSDLKKELFGRTDYGGRAFKRKLVKVFNLKFKKEGGKIYMARK
ncbi:hypothetical protein HOE04_05215 [archaeon]|jgi:hypothetical protein|nr:hypothetical protein [archaeon]